MGELRDSLQEIKGTTTQTASDVAEIKMLLSTGISLYEASEARRAAAEIADAEAVKERWSFAKSFVNSKSGLVLAVGIVVAIVLAGGGVLSSDYITIGAAQAETKVKMEKQAETNEGADTEVPTPKAELDAGTP